MFLIVLLSIVTLSSEVLAADKVAVGNVELEGVVQAVRTILNDEGFGNLYNTVVELQKKLTLQEKRIQFLEARDARRTKVVTELLMTVGDLKQKCKVQHDTNKVSASEGQMNITEKTFASHKQAAGIKDTEDNGWKRRQISIPEQVGFTAYLDHNIDHMAAGHTIKANQVLLNDGNGYNNTTGIFTVPVSGVYLFNFHFNSHFRKTLVGLFVDGKNEVDAIAVPKDSSQEMMGGNTAVLRVNRGQSVWLEDIIVNDGEIYTTPVARYATFSGVLLYMS